MKKHQGLSSLSRSHVLLLTQGVSQLQKKSRSPQKRTPTFRQSPPPPTLDPSAFSTRNTLSTPHLSSHLTISSPTWQDSVEMGWHPRLRRQLALALPRKTSAHPSQTKRPTLQWLLVVRFTPLPAIFSANPAPQKCLPNPPGFYAGARSRTSKSNSMSLWTTTRQPHSQSLKFNRPDPTWFMASGTGSMAGTSLLATTITTSSESSVTDASKENSSTRSSG